MGCSQLRWIGRAQAACAFPRGRWTQRRGPPWPYETQRTGDRFVVRLIGTAGHDQQRFICTPLARRCLEASVASVAPRVSTFGAGPGKRSNCSAIAICSLLSNTEKRLAINGTWAMSLVDPQGIISTSRRTGLIGLWCGLNDRGIK